MKHHHVEVFDKPHTKVCGTLRASQSPNTQGLFDYNYLWISILVISIFGAFLLIKTAYANPLDLPDYAFIKPDIKEAYSFAKLEGDKLTGLPCNCGCMSDAANHGGRLHSRGLIDCFMQGDVNDRGIWDSHASECGLCYQDVLYSKNLYEQGKTKDEIKILLEAKYATQTISTNTVYGEMN
ncbi:MAG: PCYCGC motif-containing (lipo)protein [Nanoarchaeota archaeon]